MRHDERQTIERFNTALDQSVNSGDRSTISGDDIELIAAHDRIRTLDATPGPNPDFVNRLKEDLMHSATMTAVNTPPRSFNGPVVQPRSPVAFGGRSTGNRRFKSQFAPRPLIATLMLIALAGGWIGYQSGLPGRGGGPANVANLAAVGTAIPAATASTERTLAQFDLPADQLTPGVAGSSTALFSIPQSSTTTWVVPQEANVFHLLEGDLTIKSDKPVAVHRNGAGAANETIPAGTSFDIAPGDSMSLGNAAVTQFVNKAPTPVMILVWGMNVGSAASPPFPNPWNPDPFDLSGGGGVTVPTGAAHIRLWKVDLKTGDTIAAPKGMVLQLGFDAEQDAAGKWSSAQAVIRAADGSILNISANTVTVYIATLTSAGGTAGSPVAASATP